MKNLLLFSPTISFKVSQVQNGPKDWYTFDVTFGANEYKEVGSQGAEYFVKPLIKILSNKDGSKLNSQSGFIDTVGIDSRYLGLFFITPGYITFYFFRKPSGNIHIVMADNVGKLLDHAEVNPSDAEKWLGILEELT